MMVLIVILTLVTLAQGAVWDNLNATLAVVEYQPVSSISDSGETKVLLNTIQFMEHVVSLSVDTSFDLIVFPESVLRTSPETAVEVAINTTCDGTCPDPLQEMSFVARIYHTYIVVNLVEKSKCEESDESSNCKKSGFKFFNTDVVFDRNGAIINKYRKYNLFGEYDLDKPETADLVIVRTDFGLNFGVFTCFDILFKTPAQDLVDAGIDGVIFPTMWFSELPFLTAVQTQQMWAQRHDVLFLAAGANSPFVGSGGSGIYKGAQGAVTSGIIGQGGSHHFIYTSSSVPPQREDTDTVARTMDKFHLKTDKAIDSYVSVILNTSLLEQDVCHDKFCCHFKINATEGPKNGSYYTYHLAAFSGVRSFDGVYNGGIELCGVLACLDDSVSSCGKRFPHYDDIEWPITFKEITVSAEFEKNVNKTQFPNSLLSSILPIEAEKTVWRQEETGNVVNTIFSTTDQNRLLTFGIFGRNFNLDSAPSKDEDPDDDDNAAGALGGTIGVLLGGILIAMFVN